MLASAAADRTTNDAGSLGVRRYLLAGSTVLAGIGLQAAVNPRPSLDVPLLVSLLAVIVTAYFAGRGPALAAVAASILADLFFLAHPRLGFASAGDRWRMVAFAALGTAVSLLSHRFSRARYFRRVALMAASSLFLGIVAMLVWFDFADSRQAGELVDHNYQVLNATEQVFSAIQDADARERGYLLTGEPQYLERYRELVRAEQAAMEGLRRLTMDNRAQQIRVAELDRLVNARLSVIGQGIAARRGQGLQAAIAVVRRGEGPHLMSGIRSVLAAVQAEEHRLLIQRTQAAAARARRMRWALAAGTAVLIALLVFAGAVIERDVGKLRDSARMLRRQADLLDKAQGPIVTWELGGAIEYWNRGAEELYGFSREQAVGRSYNDLLHPVHPIGNSGIHELLARDGEWSGELTHVIGGREIIVESHLTLVTEPDGRRTVLKANRDITQQKHAQQQILQLNRELEQRVTDRTAQLETANQELEAFAYSVSHDLRAPLRGIDGWSLALLEDYGSELHLTARQYLERVRAETQRMGQLIDDLLKLSRLTRIELAHESVDLSSLARAIAGRLREAEPNRAMEFIVQEKLATGGDAHLLGIVLSNLLSNAVKFTGPRARARIEFGQTKHRDELAFFVRDNGVGFDLAHAGMMFGAFQRLHKPAEFPGNGIGLATVQRVVRRHGGKIWADAKPDEGATFYFTIGPAALWDRANQGNKVDREVPARMV
jgi:PAS domain S-box-containing protein